MAYAQVVIMGGSFDQTGGHNLIEPANLGCAIITGPSDSNIHRDIELLLSNQAVFQAIDFSDCWKKVDDLLNDPVQAIRMGKKARQVILNQPDIVKAYLSEIMPYLAQA
jgi:3-deoxy-D-manno-octulosonic-acid transferase